MCYIWGIIVSKYWTSLRKNIYVETRKHFYISWINSVTKTELSFLKWKILTNWSNSTIKWTHICYTSFLPCTSLYGNTSKFWQVYRPFYLEKLHVICMYEVWQQNHFLCLRFIVLNSNISFSSWNCHVIKNIVNAFQDDVELP